MRKLEGLRVFVVEDELLLALGLEDDLADAGCTVLGPFGTVAEALKASTQQRFDVATLDVNLNGEFVYPLADELLARGKPFLFLTGYGAADLPERFRALPRVSKPYDPVTLIRELGRTAGRPG